MKYAISASVFFICIALFSSTVVAQTGRDVVPVPKTVEPERIDGVKPRNVVFILSDDHRYDAMSFMNHQFAETPHMDAMAKMVFT